MPALSEAPLEIYTSILRNCGSFSTLKSLILTSRKFNDAWKENSSSIIWDVGRADVMAFNDALMAVRATEIVKESVLAGQLPPQPFPLWELCGRPGRYPSFHELRLVFDFEHFARYVEINMSLYRPYGPWDGYSDSPDQNIPDLQWKPWENFSDLPWLNTPDLQWDRRWKFHSAIYRVLLGGAVLYGTYNQPFVQDEPPEFPNFLKFLKEWMANFRAGDDTFPPGFTNADVQYLQRFPVYNIHDHLAQQPFFHDFAELLVNESRIRLRDEGPITEKIRPCLDKPLVDNLNPLQSIILHETGQFAHAYEKLTSTSDFYVHGDGLRSRLVYDLDVGTSRTSREFSGDATGPFRKVTIIILGIFRLDEVSMPPVLANEKMQPLILNPLNPSFPSFQHIDMLLDEFHRHSDHINGYNSLVPTPYPPIDFVEYILRTYLRLRFGDGAFTIFTLDDVESYQFQMREAEGAFVEPWTRDAMLEDASVIRGKYDYFDDGNA